MTHDPEAKSRVAGTGATRLIPVEPAVSTRITDQTTSFTLGAAPTHAAPAGGVVGTREQHAVGDEYFSQTWNVGTSLPAEYSPGVLYVHRRLVQMYERSKLELQPYPDEWLIASTWHRAWALIAPGVPTPSVVPSEEGNVSFVWHKNGWDIELEFGLMASEIWASRRDSNDVLEGTLEETGTELEQLLRNLSAGQPNGGE